MNDETEPQEAHEVAADIAFDDSCDHVGPVLVSMNKPASIGESGFFNADNPDDAVPEIVLRRVLEDGKEIFQLERPLGYWDAHVGGIIVPNNLASFFTDLASVPQLLTWLIPRTGKHLPAALLHDGLVLGPDEPQTYVAETDISRVEADRIFRDAMKDLDTPALSRWLIWATVAAATKTKKVVWKDTTPEATSGPDETAELGPAPLDSTSVPRTSLTNTSLNGTSRKGIVASQNWLGWLVVAGSALIVATLGTIATLELIDCWNVIPGLEGQRTLVEFGVGIVAAIITPTILSLFWGREWRAGILLGIALSMLLHLMAAILIVFGLFRSADHFSAARYGLSAFWLAVSTCLAGAVGLLVTLVC